MATSYNTSASSAQPESLRPYVESIDLYKKYVADTLGTRLLMWIYEYWGETQKKLAKERTIEGPFADLVAFQEALQRIPDWDDEQVKSFMTVLFSEEHVADAKNKLRTALSRIVAANTALLAAAAPREIQRNLTVQTPAPSFFVHETLISVAQYLFRHPEMVRREDDDGLTTVIERTIETEVRKLTPYDTILTEALDETAQPAAAPSPPSTAAAPPADDDAAAVAAEDAVPEDESRQKPAAVTVHEKKRPTDADADEDDDDGNLPPVDPADDDLTNSNSESGSDDELDDAQAAALPPPPPPPARHKKQQQPQSSNNRSRYARQAS